LGTKRESALHVKAAYVVPSSLDVQQLAPGTDHNSFDHSSRMAITPEDSTTDEEQEDDVFGD
jgi:hypothetical protein